MSKSILSVFVFVLSVAAFAGNPTADCFKKARNSSSSVKVHDATRLCRGAKSVAPADCFIEVRNSSSSVTVNSAVELCRPVLCPASGTKLSGGRDTGELIEILTEKQLESKKLGVVRIDNPMFKVIPNEEWDEEIVLPGITKIDETPSNGRYTAEFICRTLGYGAFVDAGNPMSVQKEAILRFMTSSFADETEFFFYKNSAYRYDVLRSVFCKLK